jgi:GNAT superfamily N-acetyltransferase
MGFTLLYPTFSSVSQARIFTLNDLFVHPDHRKKGVASELMNAAGNFAKLLGAVRLQLETENTNVNAQALYKKEGWQMETNFFYNKKL